MDFSNIGLGKTGNNPYQMMNLGGGLLKKLLSMGGTGGGGGDPSTQEFLAESEAAGHPLATIPREMSNSGLIPMLLSKAGIISPNLTATPWQYALEQILAQEKARQHFTDAAQSLTDILNATEKGGPIAGSQLYKSYTQMNPDMVPPGLDPSQWQSAALIHAQAEKAKEDYETKHLGIMQQDADTREQRAYDLENRQTHLQEREADRLDAQVYGHVLTNLGANSRAIGGDPDVASQSSQAYNYVNQAWAQGKDPNQAMREAFKRWPKAMQGLDAPEPSSQPAQQAPSMGLMDYMRYFRDNYMRGNPASAATPNATLNATATPRTRFVRPNLK